MPAFGTDSGATWTDCRKPQGMQPAEPGSRTPARAATRFNHVASDGKQQKVHLWSRHCMTAAVLGRTMGGGAGRRGGGNRRLPRQRCATGHRMADDCARRRRIAEKHAMRVISAGRAEPPYRLLGRLTNKKRCVELHPWMALACRGAFGRGPGDRCDCRGAPDQVTKKVRWPGWRDERFDGGKGRVHTPQR